MAVESYLAITPYGAGATPLPSEHDGVSLRDLDGHTFPGDTLIPLESYSFGIEQTLNIGSQSTGSGAGRVTFDTVSFTKVIDVLSPVLFQACATGKAYQRLDLLVRRTGRGGSVFLQYTIKLAAVKSISYAEETGYPREVVAFEYGGLQIRYAAQDPKGGLGPVVVGGWNRVRNSSDLGDDPIQ